jgi:replication factor C small subunit
MSVIDFTIPKDQKAKLASLFFKRIQEILKKESVEFDVKSVGALIVKYFPDCRRIINELQRYAATGKIDSGILALDSDESLSSLIGYLKNKEFTNVRKWVGEYNDLDATTFFRKLYDQAHTFMDSPSVAQLVLIIARYQYQHAFVSDHEINLVACLTEIMMECSFK